MPLAAIDRAAELISQADALVVAAGAGMGVDSGLPDFRGNQGFWHAYPALGRARIDFHRIASPEAFRRDPARAWGFYGHRLSLYRRVVPHPGFKILAEWGRRMPGGWAVYTSNVDGHFQRAGATPDALLECHGSIHHLQCMDDCSAAVWPADGFVPQVDEVECRLLNAAPRCPHCGALARPNILMFGDVEWNARREEAQAVQWQEWLAAVQPQQRLLVIELGAGTAVPSVRHAVQHLQQRHDARLLRINLREADVVSPLDVALPQGALAALQALRRRAG